ncbi:hypothetical protein HY449_00490 [Candidatus Pacearchaeota archaeon]|nr:hypothetical protein [Candidatus Pacearchaeota archaeon]
MKNLIRRLGTFATKTILIGGAIGLTYAPQYTLNQYNPKRLNGSRFARDMPNPIYVGYDKNNDGVPDFVIEGHFFPFGGGFSISRKPTKKEIETYKNR